MSWIEEASKIWRTHVPQRGQASTVQGELLRAVEKLRDEAQRNGNINWCNDHEVLLEYLRSTLTVEGGLSQSAEAEVIADTEKIRERSSSPVTDDAVYDRLAKHVVEWCQAHPDPVSHTHNPDLHR